MSFKAPKRTRLLWQCRAAILFLLLIAAIAGFYPLSRWVLIGAAAVATVGLVVIFWYLPCFFKSCQVEITDESIVISHGVIIKVTSIMPYPRLVYMKMFTTPLSSLFGLRGVTLKAARGIMIIPEMKRSDAEMLVSGGKGL